MNVTKNEVKAPEGPYTVWEEHGVEGWHFTDCQTLESALMLQKYGSKYVIQKPAKFKIIDEGAAS